jgi:hypothetical protein
MDIESRERLVRMEVGIENLTELLKGHIEADCAANGCALHDDVMSLKNTQTKIRRISWVFVSGLILSGLASGITYLFKGVTHVG